MHGFQNEDHVKFREVKGMECLNEKIYKIKGTVYGKEGF